jgi:hypothetical protein
VDFLNVELLMLFLSLQSLVTLKKGVPEEYRGMWEKELFEERMFI